MPHHFECEIKLVPPTPADLLRVPDLARRLGARVGNRRLERCTDYYLETEDFWFYRAGLGLRLRVDADGRGRLALKSAGPAEEVVHRRIEIEENLRDAPRALRSRRVPGRRIAYWVGAVAGPLRVRPVLVLEQTRLAFDVRLPARASAVVSCDAVRVPSRSGALRLREVEIERTGGAMEAVERFARRMQRRTRWTFEPRSKLQRAAELAGLRVPTLDDPKARPVGADDRWIDAAWKTFARQIRRFLWHEPGVRAGLEPVALHDMRVAARRFRAALSVFRRCLPPAAAAALQRDLQTTARAIGEVRDLDVSIESVRGEIRHAPPAVREILRAMLPPLAARRRLARRRMLAAFGHPRHRSLVRRMTALAAARPPDDPPGRRARRPVGKIAHSVLDRRADKVARALEDREAGDADDLHRIRILLKKFRYALEFVAPLYGRAARRVVRKIADTQDLLGAHHDETVLIATLHRARETAGPRAPDFDVLLASHRRRQRRLERACERALAEWADGGLDRTLRRLRRAAG